MNYCDKIHYHVFITDLAPFDEMVDALLAQLPKGEQILRLAFFGKPADNAQYVSRRILLREKIRKYYGNHEPVLSYVSQPPLNAGLILEAHSYTPEESDH
ncbi:MAG: endoribonuclease L-PSP, partial [Parabacteroides sp.]|nr:endoribonuclease L-PSP [Parabacteroides sp.]